MLNEAFHRDEDPAPVRETVEQLVHDYEELYTQSCHVFVTLFPLVYIFCLFAVGFFAYDGYSVTFGVMVTFIILLPMLLFVLITGIMSTKSFWYPRVDECISLLQTHWRAVGSQSSKEHAA